MTVGELKKLLEERDNEAEVLYFDSEAGENLPMTCAYISFNEKKMRKDKAYYNVCGYLR